MLLNKAINAVLTVLAGIGVALIGYWLLDKISNLFPGRAKELVRPYLYILPAFAAIGLYLVYPAIQTVVLSFANDDSTKWVGWKNYTTLLSNTAFQLTLFNTLLWMIVVPAVTILAGLMIAVLADRLPPRNEKFVKTIIFLPMAISAVGAATVWRFVYNYDPPGQKQIGLLNAIIGAFNIDPVPWLQQSTAHVNTFMIMIMVLWAQVGFAMVLLSSAIKGVPGDTLEAARIDGANEKQIFRRVVIPQVKGTIITVLITVTITVMKLFDIIFTATAGDFDTNVIGNEFYLQLTTNGDKGSAAAIVVMLMVAVLPVLYYQIRHFRAEEANR
jgi:alpha-glucoside transport system permease protein